MKINLTDNFGFFVIWEETRPIFGILLFLFFFMLFFFKFELKKKNFATITINIGNFGKLVFIIQILLTSVSSLMYISIPVVRRTLFNFFFFLFCKTSSMSKSFHFCSASHLVLMNGTCSVLVEWTWCFY